MNAIGRAIGRARRRLGVQRFVDALGWYGVAAAGVMVVMVLADRLAGLSAPGWAYGVVAGLAVVAAGVRAVWGLPRGVQIAARLDDRLGLKDRIGTALYAESLPAEARQGDAFAEQVATDGEKAAAAAAINRAFPVKVGASWTWCATAGVLAALVALLVPAGGDIFGLQRQQKQEEEQLAEAEEARQQVVEARHVIEEMEAEAGDLEEADLASLLRELASLTDRDLSTPRARQEALAELSAMEDQVADAKERQERSFQGMQSQMSQLDAGEPGPADRFTEALRRSDFAAAQQELQRLAERFDQGEMSEAEREALAQQLENLEQQLQQMAQQSQQQQQAMQQAMQQQLQQAGLSQEEIQQLQQQGMNSQAVQQALQQAYQQQGMNPQQAQQMAQQQAQQMQQMQQQAQQQQQQAMSQSQMSQAMSQMCQACQGGGQGGQQQGQQGQFSQSAFGAQQQLQQMAQMQAELQRMGAAQQQLQQAMQSMQGGQPSQASGTGGRQWGTGSGGNAMGQERQTGPYQVEHRRDIQNRQGRVIASWMQQGENAPGEAQLEFDRAVTGAREQAERAVTEDRVPRRYHGAIQDYFGQLPESASDAGRAPAAPR